MKKFFAIAVLAALFTMSAYAQPGNNNQDQGNQTYKIYVICPIKVNPDGGTVDLGTIIPGQTKNGGFVNPNAEFTVTGHAGEQFTPVGVLTTTGTFGGTPTGSVTILTHHWEQYDGTNWTSYTQPSQPLNLLGGNPNNYADCNASRKVRCVVTSVQASNDASSGTWQFPVTLTATYFGV